LTKVISATDYYQWNEYGKGVSLNLKVRFYHANHGQLGVQSSFVGTSLLVGFFAPDTD